MADLFEGLGGMGVEMCQCPCDATGAVQDAAAQAQARLLGDRGGIAVAPANAPAHALCAVGFFLMVCFCLWRFTEPLAKVQMMCLRNRLDWCIKANVFVCTMSCVFGVLHCTNFEELLYNSLGLMIKPIEFLVTCPCMMLILVVMAGEKVPARRQTEVIACTICALMLGWAAQATTSVAAKVISFIGGVGFLGALLHRIEMSVRQHSGGEESMLSGGFGGSVYKKMCIKTALMLVVFPLWFLFSPPGFNIVSNISIAVLITAALNIYAKCFFVLYVVIIYDIYVGAGTLLSKAHDGKVLDHQPHGEAEAAARFGPDEAISALEKATAKNQESISHIRQFMVRDEQRKQAVAAIEEQAIHAAQSKQGMPSKMDDMSTQGVVNSGMLKATPAGINHFPSVASMGGMSTASSLPGGPQQQLGGAPRTAPLVAPSSTGSMISRGSTWARSTSGPDHADPHGMRAQFQHAETHVAAAPTTFGAAGTPKAPEQLANTMASQQAQMPQAFHQMQGAPPPVHQMYTNQIAQQQELEKQHHMFMDGRLPMAAPVTSHGSMPCQAGA